MAFRELLLTDRHFADLNPLIAGQEDCAPGHSFGPRVRNYTLIHYVLRGTGTLYARGGVHPVGPGQAFLILPGEVTTYTADSRDPWHYCWVGFNGSLAAHFASLDPVFSLPEAPMQTILRMERGDPMPEYRLAALLFELYALLLSPDTHGNRHVRRVKDYIRTAYMQPVRVEQIAAMLNLDRRYLSRLFKEQTGQTIQEYLIQVRLEAAQRCLQGGSSVQEAAQLCGYEDVANFSKMFRRRCGLSPGQYGKTAGD